MTIYQLSVSYRDTNDINRFPFPTFAAAVRYGRLLEQFNEQLNGYTIRLMVPEPEYGSFRAIRVLKHVCWHIPSYAKLTYKKRHKTILNNLNNEQVKKSER